ncbi:NTP transferase domain-containing protein [Natronobeatus ordinarius]|uniref:NTP transferase domain-containing protein n=1 Tax=Natronobeatus ordinarius TaxID=2963433 RepID=UPI0020CE3E71|nr:NTP transferase domain-containing protein [Natronobeatus ordinarius]
MCGGQGTRLEADREKPLVRIGGTPMVDRVLEALRASRVGTIYAAVSPNAPETREHLVAGPRVTTVETPGEGYVNDLLVALDGPLEPPVLTVAADLPLLSGAAVDRVLERTRAQREAGSESATVCVPVALKRRLGASVETAFSPHLTPTGVNVVGDSVTDMTYVSYDPRLAINVNRREDARIAEELCE